MSFEHPETLNPLPAAKEETLKDLIELRKQKQQDLLRDTAISLGITQEQLAAEMSVPWGTFKKWMLPSHSTDLRGMPSLAVRTLQLLLEVHELKSQVRAE